MLVSVLLVLVSCAALVSVGIFFNKKDKLKAGGLLVGGVIFMFLSVLSMRAPFTLLKDGEMRNAAYVLDYKLVETDGTIVLLVSDAKTGSGRIVSLSKYPPDGYREVVSRDRPTLLLNESLIRSPPPK